MSHLNVRGLFWLVAVTMLALGLRVAALDQIPPGLHHDEALNGLEARDLLLSGARPVYLGSGFNGEPLLEYSMMLSEAWQGLTPLAVRLPSALYGTLAVPLVYLLMLSIAGRDAPPAPDGARTPPGGTRAPLTRRKRLWPLDPTQRTALIAAFVLATLYWHLNASREGYKPVLLPLFGALTFVLLIPALRLDEAAGKRRWLLPAATGAALGAGFYTYPSIRFLYPVVALYAGLVLWRDRARWRALAGRLALSGVIALLIFAPLGIYYLQHPGAFFTRSDQVAVWATRPEHAAEAIAENAVKVAGMFFVEGDDNSRHNLPGRPAFDLILAVGFVAGLSVAARRWRQPEYAILPLWLAAMVTPSIVTEAAPNFLRALGATAPAVMLVALGWGALSDWLERHLAGSGIVELALMALLIVSAAFSLNAYFNIFPRDPRTWYAFDVGLARIGALVRDLPRDERIYLTPFDSGQATIQFAMGEPHPNLKWFDGRKCLVAPAPERTATYLVVNEDPRTLNHLREYWSEGRAAAPLRDFGGRDYLTLFRAPAQVWSNEPRTRFNTTFGGVLNLVGYSIMADRVQTGQGIPVVLYWHALRPLEKDYTVFTHLRGGANPRTGTPLWGQLDGPPCAGGYPTTRWEPGETVVHDFLVVVDNDAKPGAHRVVMGVYDASGARLRLPDGADELLLGQVEIFRK